MNIAATPRVVVPLKRAATGRGPEDAAVHAPECAFPDPSRCQIWKIDQKQSRQPLGKLKPFIQNRDIKESIKITKKLVINALLF
jgi:hypothetical protein